MVVLITPAYTPEFWRFYVNYTDLGRHITEILSLFGFSDDYVDLAPAYTTEFWPICVNYVDLAPAYTTEFWPIFWFLCPLC